MHAGFDLAFLWPSFPWLFYRYAIPVIVRYRLRARPRMRSEETSSSVSVPSPVIQPNSSSSSPFLPLSLYVPCISGRSETTQNTFKVLETPVSSMLLTPQNSIALYQCVLHGQRLLTFSSENANNSDKCSFVCV